MQFRIVVLVLMPTVISVMYVRVWPGVTSRPILTGILGASVGVIAAVVALAWSVWPVLTNIAVSGGTAPGPTLAQLTSGRAVWAYLFALVASIFSVWLVAKLVGAPKSVLWLRL